MNRTIRQRTGRICVVAQWPGRPEPLEVSSLKMLKFLSELAVFSPMFKSWVEYPRTFRDSEKYRNKPGLDQDEIQKLFEMSVQRTEDESGQIIPKLGHSILAWNRDNGGIRCSLSASIGMYDVDFWNVIYLKIEQLKPPPLKSEDLVSIVLMCAQVWEANLSIALAETFDYSKNVEIVGFHVPGSSINSVWKLDGKLKRKALNGELTLNESVAYKYDNSDSPLFKADPLGDIIKRLLK